MRYWVYIHTCPNGKKYIGVTHCDRPERRWRDGKGYSGNEHFSRAIKKYGWNNIVHEVREVGSEEEMYSEEIRLISLYRSNNPDYGYNNSSGGESNKGCKWSLEARERISLNRKGIPKSEEFRKKCSEGHKGLKRGPLTEEHKLHLSSSLKGKIPWNKGIPRTQEVKEKISQANQGRTQSEETRRKISEACKKKPRFKIKLPDGTIKEMTKANLTKNYLNKGIKVTIECI